MTVHRTYSTGSRLLETLHNAMEANVLQYIGVFGIHICSFCKIWVLL